MFRRPLCLVLVGVVPAAVSMQQLGAQTAAAPVATATGVAAPAAAGPADPANPTTVSFTQGGRPVSLTIPHVVSGIPTTGVPATGTAGQLVIDLPPTPDSITARLADNRHCVTAGGGTTCSLEGSISVPGSNGAPTATYLMHGASITALKLKGAAGNPAGRTGRMTIRYAALETAPPPIVPTVSTAANGALGPAATDAPAAQPTQPKKHKGFGKFVVGMVKDHGLQVVEMATPIGMASMAMHSLSVAKAANGALAAQSPSQVSSVAQMIMSSSGNHQINLGGALAGASPLVAQAYAANYRKQLIAQGVDTSRFTVTTGAPPSGTRTGAGAPPGGPATAGMAALTAGVSPAAAAAAALTSATTPAPARKAP